MHKPSEKPLSYDAYTFLRRCGDGLTDTPEIHKLLIKHAEQEDRQLTVNDLKNITDIWKCILENAYTTDNIDQAEYYHWVDHHGRPHNPTIESVYARKWLVCQGLLLLGRIEPNNSRERIQCELNTLYPNAKSKEIISYEGKNFHRVFFPLHKSLTGKTVHKWGHKWEEAE